MLDIQKELERFNRLLEEVEEQERKLDVGIDNESEPQEEPEIDEAVAAEPTASEVAAMPAEEETDRGVVEPPVQVITSSVEQDLDPAFDEVTPIVPGSPTGSVEQTAMGEGTEPFGGLGNPVHGDVTPVAAYNVAGDTGDSDKPWTITEHVRPTDFEQPADSPAAEIVEDPWDQPEVDNDIPSQQEAFSWPASDQGRQYPNPGAGLGSYDDDDREPTLPRRNPIGSLILGAKSALTATHYPKSRNQPQLTLTIPDRRDEDPDEVVADGDILARILPLLDYGSSLVEGRMGMVAGAVAGVVLLIGAVAFLPSVFSGDDAPGEEIVAAEEMSTEADHLHASAEPVMADGQASLSISTFPPGARVYLNAELVGVTPFRGISVDAGEYLVSIEKHEFAGVDTMFSLQGSREFFFELKQETTGESEDLAFNKLNSDAVSVVEAPVVAETRDRQIQQAESANRRREQVPESTSTRDSRSSRRSTTPVRPATGSLVVTSEPAGATVAIDGEEVGTTPFSLSDVAAGSARISMSKEGYVPYETDINITPSIQTPFHATLAAVKGTLVVNVTPGGDLYVDGVKVGSSIRPGHQELVDAGQRAVRVVHPEYGQWSTTVDVAPDGRASVQVDLPAYAYDSLVQSADVHFGESRYQQAIEDYRKALNLRPGVTRLENRIALAAKAITESAIDPDGANSSDGIYAVADTPPVLIGGLEALHASIIYPEEAYNAGVQGRVYVQFVVDESGKAQDVTIAKGLPMGCNDAAIRAVKRAKFKPGTVAGVPVKVRNTLFVNFTID